MCGQNRKKKDKCVAEQRGEGAIPGRKEEGREFSCTGVLGGVGVEGTACGCVGGRREARQETSEK